jgi:hypothetical protein
MPKEATTASTIRRTAAFSPLPVFFMPTIIPFHHEVQMRNGSVRMRKR